MKAVSAPLGVIFAVLIAIVLVLLTTFAAFYTSTRAVKSQTSPLVPVGQPYAFYNKTDDVISKIVVVVENPSGKDINVTGIEVKGSIIYLRKPAIIPAGEKASLEFYDVHRGRSLRLRLRIVYENGTVKSIWASDGSLAEATQGKVSGDVASGFIEFDLITSSGLFKIVAKVEVVE